MKRKDVVAILLAGGQGSRLNPLTKNIAKPALPFGAEYRIIDFALSNCANSGIDTIGVLVQYKPFILNSYLKKSRSWNIDRMSGGITILPPYTKSSDMIWYKGTANAVYHNYEFLEYHNPKDVLILSGDHIYKMNYLSMLEYHQEKDADITIAVVPVPLKEASRFGILNTDEKMRITDFQEKPKYPKSHLASMGIYIYKWDVLKEYLSNKEEDIDFGKDIIPRMIKDNRSVYAYRYGGYWKDIGVMGSYWDAHMDLLKDTGKDLLFDKEWPIYSANSIVKPQYISKKAVIKNSMIGSGALIQGTIINSVIFQNVQIGPDTVVKNSIILPNTEILCNSVIEKSIIGSDSIVRNNVRVGLDQSNRKDTGISVIADKCDVPEGSIITSGRIVEDGENYYSSNEVYYA